ncbi:hypothetical protein CEUSTIGMA_g9823.t1 [Chlamydomonas eustigma]|uniref:Tetratricopeptide SHNi-TPR domain-containing protein n=1 Tax=Chlamydomonas eustigma TaxID=1157962 RepID=A0A250XH39_9CHLO|nr:hypothetical protein CEUSTIGMA_g9823.t1 [Chlamydomonas eustigma]|eukprot:GAX82395.1 hypothetical protein CEUSTIGMA_g9823.t1 [Chlamydomonas eustigma]
MSNVESSDQCNEAYSLFTKGKKAIFSDPDTAVGLLQQSLKIYVDLGLGIDVKVAPVYLAYGMVLVEIARSGVDAFGQDIPPETVAGQPQECDQPIGTDQDEDGQEESEGHDGEKEAGGAEGRQEDPSDPQITPKAEIAEENNDTPVDADAVDSSDFSLAWEMLELAKTLFLEDGKSKHLLCLSDVHSTLCDIMGENGDFSGAYKEVKAALEYAAMMQPPDLRNEAELHFKAACGLQMDHQAEMALPHAEKALSLMMQVRNDIEKTLEPLDELIKAGDAKAAEVLEEGEAKMKDLDTCMQPVTDKIEDLKITIGEAKKMKMQIGAMFKSLVGAGAPMNQATAEAAAQAVAAAARGSGGDVETARQALQKSTSGASFAAVRSNPHAPVMDLGVVGRGRARITLTATGQESQAPSHSIMAADAQSPKKAETAAAASSKRSRLEAIMGGIGGSTSLGFGGNVGRGGLPSITKIYNAEKDLKSSTTVKGDVVHEAQCIVSTSQGPSELQKDDAASVEHVSASKKLKGI